MGNKEGDHEGYYPTNDPPLVLNENFIHKFQSKSDHKQRCINFNNKIQEGHDWIINKDF